jgi:hypothetical protein
MHISANNRGIPVVLGALIAIAGATFGALAEHALGGAMVKGQIPWTMVYIALAMAFICYVIYRLFERVEDLYLRMRLSIRYYPATDENNANAMVEMYGASRRLLNEAKEDGTCEILAVNWFAQPFGDPTSPEVESAHEAYFAALERKLGKVNYHRIVQYNDSIPTGDLDKYISLAYRKHLAKVIEHRDAGPAHHVVRLDKVPPRYPVSFVIIENEGTGSFLIWRLDEFATMSKEGPVFRPRGLFLVTDPEHQLIQHFRDWFTRLTNDADTRPLRKEEFTSSV